MLFPLLLCLLAFIAPLARSCIYHDYCVVGAGPSGLQMGYFLESKGRDYVVFERSNSAGSFYETYPRHRKLISINKRHTGQVNPEFNLRHDWNSLLSHDPDLLVTKYSKEMFPHADALLRYLKDYQTKLGIKVQFNTKVHNIHSVPNATAPDGHVYRLQDQTDQVYVCRTLIMATGMATPNIPPMKGIELAEGYETMSLDPEDYEGKTVLILGRGNSAFEVANGIYGATNLIHMVARSRVRLAWATHYVGDLRAVNNELLDTYQLKSLDGLLESSLSHMVLVKRDDKIHFTYKANDFTPDRFDNIALREPYDVVIRALGFTFDDTVFNQTAVSRGKFRAKKYPAIKHNYESVDSTGMFYAGTASHSLDFRKSAGGFIHGFRYTARALHRLLEWRYEGVRWPSFTVPRSQLLNVIVKRVNEASGTYQMFQVLGDVAVFSEDGLSVTYLEEFPIHLIHELPQRTGIQVFSVLAVVLEYGQNFSGPGNDIFRSDRATGEPSEAHTSNFLHPVLYFYKNLPTEEMMQARDRKSTLPRPDALHHVVEDFTTQFTAQHSHILPLRRFLENIVQQDLRAFFSESCFQLAMTHAEIPEACGSQYMAGHGLLGNPDLLQSASSTGMLNVL
ncbi:FAD-dependent oxidoreductase domain-containing protein 2 [Aplysia californica]|uniref:FAD-dependent oxidoreductase domain-containing protein 2 n=1 Tax=Aplysia californica TaxID=6500 RepID=A0ABM0JSL7_APLCA|nr:FAD-dependent oxidoreductase domain-containing protein 2 [Aplysia californica]